MGAFKPPSTLHGHDPYEVVSAFQKMVRRSREREAMAWALEMVMSNKWHYTFLLNRIRVICYEDIGLADPQAVFTVIQACDLIAERYQKPPYLLAISHIVRALCRAAKSREGDEFMQVTALDFVANGPGEIPDVALDKHTLRGKKQGRGMDHFVSEGSRVMDCEGMDYPASAYHDEWKTLMEERDKFPPIEKLCEAKRKSLSGDQPNSDVTSSRRTRRGELSKRAGKLF